MHRLPLHGAPLAGLALVWLAGRYAVAVNALNSFLAQCKDHMNWIEIDQVRNDLALAQYRSGRPASCLATLKATLASGFEGEEDLKTGNSVHLPPCDFDNYIPVAKATWFNRMFLKDQLTLSREITLTGKWDARRMQLTVTDSEFPDKGVAKTGTLQPVYSVGGGITQAWMRKTIGQALAQYGSLLEENLPERLVAKSSACLLH